MQPTTALAMANGYAPNTEQLGQLSDILCPNFINQCLEATGVATVRKRRIPLRYGRLDSHRNVPLSTRTRLEHCE